MRCSKNRVLINLGCEIDLERLGIKKLQRKSLIVKIVESKRYEQFFQWVTREQMISHKIKQIIDLHSVFLTEKFTPE